MNKYTIEAIYLKILIFLIVPLYLNSQEVYLKTNTEHLKKENLFSNGQYRKIKKTSIEANIEEYNHYSVIGIDYNEVTKKYIQKYLDYRWIGKVMGLGSFYFPLFESKFQKYGLPEELKYLAVVESNLNPRAISHVGASGLWQFMPATGKEYGLGKNDKVNLFYDPIASTESACRYLLRLYKIFGDWKLVLSAYNAGEGTVLRAIKKAGSKNYWKVRRFLPSETKAYVPTFFAVSYVFNFNKAHGIESRKFDLSYEDVVVSKSKSEIEIDQLENKKYYYFLNPQFTKGIIPKGAFFYEYR